MNDPASETGEGTARSERFAAKIRLGQIAEQVQALGADLEVWRVLALQLADEMNALRERAAEIRGLIERERDVTG